MEEVSDDFREISRSLLEEFAGLGRRMSPKMRNASRGEMGVLKALLFAQGPLTPKEIAEKCLLSPARVANVLRALEEKGDIAREHSRQDRRRVAVSLTDAGRARLDQGKADFEDQAGAFLAQLGREDAEEALRILRRINQIVDQNRAAQAAAGTEEAEEKGGPAA